MEALAVHGEVLLMAPKIMHSVKKMVISRLPANVENT
jgi:hypothetical protein